MSIIIRLSVDNDTAEAIPLMMWLRYLTGQWERYFEMERDMWHPPTTCDRSGFQASLSWFSITTWPLNYPVELQFLNTANSEMDVEREIAIIGWEPNVSDTLVDPHSSAVLLLIQFFPYLKGLLPSTQVLMANITEKWKNRDFFPLKPQHLA